MYIFNNLKNINKIQINKKMNEYTMIIILHITPRIYFGVFTV